MTEEIKSGVAPGKPKFSGKRLAITIGIVVTTAAIIGGAVWYFMDKSAKEEEAASAKTIEEAKKATPKKTTPSTSSGTSATTASTEPTSSWKLYTDAAGRFTIKYPDTWTYKMNAGMDGTYFSSNRFSDDNVIFYNAAKQVAIGLNMGETLGRGGACTKRSITYTPTVTTKKLTIAKKTDTTVAVSTDEYCGVGETLTGYQTTIETFTEAAIPYFIHSEGVGATDVIASEVIDIFEKMAATMTFK